MCDSIIKKLADMGCEMEKTMERFLGDEEFYMECFENFVTGEEMEKLGDILKKGDVQASFSAAHQLKGTLSNLGLVPIYERMSGIVETLRSGEDSGVINEYEKMMVDWNQYKNMLQVWRKNEIR